MHTHLSDSRPRSRNSFRITGGALAKSALIKALSCALLNLSPMWARADVLGSDLHGVLDYARRQSPELAAMRLEAEAAVQRVQPAGALPDPVLRVELENINNYGTDSRPNLLPGRVGATRYTFIQPLPAWGKRDLRRDVAAADAQQADARAEATWLELATRVKRVYAEYFLVAGSERLAREILDLVARLEQAAQARYAGGLAPQQDAVRAQLERSATQRELIALDAEKRQRRARLNALLGRDADAPLAEPAALGLLPAAVLSADLGVLWLRAQAANPQLRAEHARVRGAQSNRELTLRNRYPDFQVGVSPMQERSRLTSWG